MGSLISELEEYGHKALDLLEVFGMKLVPKVKRDYWEIPHLKPEKSDRGNYIFIPDVIIGLENNANPLVPWFFMVRECSRYDGEVHFAAPRLNNRMARGTSSMDLLMMELSKDTLVNVTVTGEDKERAIKQALRIYSGITTLGKIPNFERFNQIPLEVSKNY